MRDTQCDFLIIGGGIAGASTAFALAPHGRVIILERESQPGYHSTGRSAAMFMESYGTEQVRALTRASRGFFEYPPDGFTDVPLLTPRGALYVASENQREHLEMHWADIRSTGAQVERLDSKAAIAMIPVLRPEHTAAALYEADASDIDVHALHQGYLRVARRLGVAITCNAETIAIEYSLSGWRVQTTDAQYRAPILINAAGAWADQVASLATVASIGIEPRRRSAFLFAPPRDVDVSRWPLAVGASEDWYMKPVGNLLLGSPANADPASPQDVQPDEMDIAVGVERIEERTTLTIDRPSHTWAGLRSFVADGDLVGGFDQLTKDFFWVAAQGGYGIQTSPAMGEACAALARRQPIPARIADYGLSASLLSPSRLQRP